MNKSIKVSITVNKSNGQCNISLPARKLKEIGVDLKKMKGYKLKKDGFEQW